ncbi:hypothetical protein BH11CYA1_BH11CYA1_08920 [soil metagenome]
MNYSIQTGIVPQSSLVLVPLSELRQAYRHMRVAAKPIRRLVDNPDEVSSAVPPAVQAYLPVVSELIAALSNIDQMTSSANQSSVVGDYITRLTAQQMAAVATVNAAITEQETGSSTGSKGHKLDLPSDSYQAYATLFNTCVDAYHEVVDGRRSQHGMHQ